jgi:hypothetical protein
MLSADQESAALEITISIPYSAMAVAAALMALVLTLSRPGGQTPADGRGDQQAPWLPGGGGGQLGRHFLT